MIRLASGRFRSVKQFFPNLPSARQPFVSAGWEISSEWIYHERHKGHEVFRIPDLSQPSCSLGQSLVLAKSEKAWSGHRTTCPNDVPEKLIHSSVPGKVTDYAHNQIEDSQEERSSRADNYRKWNEQEQDRSDIGLPFRTEPNRTSDDNQNQDQDTAPSRNIRRRDAFMLPTQNKRENDEERGEDVHAPEPPKFADRPGPECFHARCLIRCRSRFGKLS